MQNHEIEVKSFGKFYLKREVIQEHFMNIKKGIRESESDKSESGL